MEVSRETPEQTDARLRRVIAAATLRTFPGTWWFHEFAPADFPNRVRHDAVALVRDADGWSQLVPVGPGDTPAERIRLWSFHFVGELDNSGFVGWLASHIKRITGSGVLVVCGHNTARGGIYDYWGCPERVASAVLGGIGMLRGGSADIGGDRDGRDQP